MSQISVAARSARVAARAPLVAAFQAMTASVGRREAATLLRAIAPVPVAPTPTDRLLPVPALAPTARIVVLRDTSPKKDAASVSGQAWLAYADAPTVADYLALRTLPDGSVFPKGKAAAALRFDIARGYVRLEA